MAEHRPLPGWPRALNEHLASAYVSLSVSQFRTEVGAGRAPAPIHLTPRRIAWLREDLDAYLDRLAGREPTSDPSQDWQKCFEGDTPEIIENASLVERINATGARPRMKKAKAGRRMTDG